jgi:CheY-like chemotaxis protein
MHDTAPPILLVDDSEEDIALFRLAVKRAGLTNRVIRTVHGRMAMAYLAGEGPFSDRTTHPWPGLVVLDLTMPLMSGCEVLAWLTSQPQFDDLPVVVLSSSVGGPEIEKARELGADDLIAKPSSHSELTEVVSRLHERWLTAERVPLDRAVARLRGHAAHS